MISRKKIFVNIFPILCNFTNFSPIFFLDISEEEENADPKNNSLPTPPLNKKLKRKSRAVTNRRYTKDEDISNDEAK